MEYTRYCTVWNNTYIFYYVHTIHDITECARDSIGRIGSGRTGSKLALVWQTNERGAARGAASVSKKNSGGNGSVGSHFSGRSRNVTLACSVCSAESVSESGAERP